MPRSNRPKRPRRGTGRGPAQSRQGGQGGRGGAGGDVGSLARFGTPEVEYAGQVWAVRQVRGNDSGRGYLCPGCQHEVSAGEAHTVVWPTEGMRGMENRRHWHSRCWQRRERWAPGGSWA